MTAKDVDSSTKARPAKPQSQPASRLGRLLNSLGPGLITGASDDDPSGIGTYSQAGAQLGYSIGWTMLMTYPLMTGIQEISARLGRVTGHGLAGNVCRHYPASVLNVLITLLFVANTINIGADLGAMADATKLLIGGPGFLYVLLFGVISVTAQIFSDYKHYVAVLKWLTLVLFAYVAGLAIVQVRWAEALQGTLIPQLQWDQSFLTTLVAILGTTISPYLFIWQSSQEAEDERIDKHKKPLVKAPQQAPGELRRIRIDTAVGMAFSNLIALAIMLTTAATLHSAGMTNVETSAQAAEALRPIAGRLAEFVFAIGIIGTGLLAIPVLAGSTAYAVGEGRKWPVGLSRKPKRAVAFYGVLALSCGLGIALNFTPINPISALFWSAVVNGILAAPMMVLLMLMSRKKAVMGRFVVSGALAWLGWIATAAMGFCVIAMAVSALS